MTISSDITKRIALAAGYSEADCKAGLEFHLRKERVTNPPGSFDKAGRFKAAERTRAVLSARMPSRAWPYSEMTAARTAAHVAEVHGAEPLHVRRIARAVAVEAEAGVQSNHGAMRIVSDLVKILKPVKPRILQNA